MQLQPVIIIHGVKVLKKERLMVSLVLGLCQYLVLMLMGVTPEQKE